MLSPEILLFNSFVLLLETSFSVNLFPFSIQESVEEQLETTKLGSLPTRWSESLEAGRAPPSSEGLLYGTEYPSPSLDLEELGARETSPEWVDDLPFSSDCILQLVHLIAQKITKAVLLETDTVLWYRKEGLVYFVVWNTKKRSELKDLQLTIWVLYTNSSRTPLSETISVPQLWGSEE